MFKIILIFLALIFTVVNASCPEGSFEGETNCYFFQNGTIGFADAESNCVALFNGHLTSIHDGFTNALLAQKGQIFFPESTVTDFWIGLTNLMIPGNWTWMDGTNLNLNEWASGEPKNVTTNCAALSLTDGYWKSDNCFKAKPYVCRIDKSILETTTTTTTINPGYANCTFPLFYFEPTHSCYGSGGWGFINWTLGEQSCQVKGGHLTSIHSFEEYNFIKSLVFVASNYIWTGAYSNDEGKTWKWSDDTTWDYNPWAGAGGKPSNVSGCGVFEYPGLYRLPCDAKWLPICKIPLK